MRFHARQLSKEQLQMIRMQEYYAQNGFSMTTTREKPDSIAAMEEQRQSKMIARRKE